MNVDASEYFETMNLWKGYLIIEIYNGLPSAIENIHGDIINIIGQDIVGTLNFPYIESKHQKKHHSATDPYIRIMVGTVCFGRFFLH